MIHVGNMKKCTAFVLGGGGSRGALQVGALRALYEAGIVPDLLVGTSIGAVNAVSLALFGYDLNGLNHLEKAWKEVSSAQILDPRVSQVILKAMVGHPSDRSRKKSSGFFISQGITPDLQFNQISQVRLALISANIETGQPVIHGQNLDDFVLDGLLSSIAIPPWFVPLKKDGQLIIDGGAFSNLPIEPALRMGATEIFALDMDNPITTTGEDLTFSEYLGKFSYAMSRRHISLEEALAETNGVPVHCIEFRGLTTLPIWDFSNYQELIDAGYKKARMAIAAWHSEAQYN